MRQALVVAVLAILAITAVPAAESSPAGVYLELTLPDGSSHRFGPLVLDRGDAVAPGLYKLVLNGSGYVEFNFSPTADTIAALVKPFKTPDWNAIVSNDEALSWRLYVSQVSDAYEFMRRDNASNAHVASDGPARDGELTWVIAYTYTDRLEIHATESGSASWPGSPASPAPKLLVGSNMFNGAEQSAQRWVGEVWAVLIHATPGVDPRGYEVPGYGLELLFDPTWYDSSTNTFLALGASGTVSEGRLVGSAYLEAAEPRLWVVRGLYSDQYLHISLTPYGSKLKILGADGEVLAEYTIIGDQRGGIVVDYPIPWPPPATEPGGSRPDVLAWLAIPLVLMSLLSPALAWYTGLVGGLTVSLIAGVAGWLALREYSVSSGADRDIWMGLALLSIFMLVFSIAIALLKAMNRYTGRIRAPRTPDIGL